jgi:hypothetical protein
MHNVTETEYIKKAGPKTAHVDVWQDRGSAPGCFFGVGIPFCEQEFCKIL